MPSPKDKKPVPKRDDVKTGGAKSVDTKAGITTKRGDVMATNVTHREWQADVDSVDEWRDMSSTAPVLRVDVRRPNDLFVAEFSLFNLKIVSGAQPTLTRIRPGEEALMVIKLPPQSFGEEAYLETTTPEVKNEDNDEFEGEAGYDNKNTALEGGSPPAPMPGMAKIRISGPTRLAFVMPKDVTSIRYTLTALLDAARNWPHRRSLSAAPEPPFGFVSQKFGAGKILSDLVGSNDFANAIENMKRSALELNVKLPNDKRAKSLSAITKQFEDIVAKGKKGTDGIYQFDDSAAVPLLPLIAAPYRPGPKITALELPYRVLTTPIGEARWVHKISAILEKGRHELWHTRATTGLTLGGVDNGARIRAIWSEDYLQDLSVTIDRPFKMPLDAQDRRMLVQLTSGFGDEEKGGADYVPLSARADRLILSSLGGLLDAGQSWARRPKDVDMQQWRHMMSLGRDHYVRVVYAGYLLPFGHAASLIKVTERKFEGLRGSGTDNRVAVLRQRFFIVVREPVKTFDGSRHVTDGHPFPFTSVELLTRITPNLQDPDAAMCKANESKGKLYVNSSYSGGLTPRQLFWPMMELTPTGDFRFDVAAVDRGGKRTTFSMPLLFMSEVGNTGHIGEIRPGKTTLMLPLMWHVQQAYNAADNIRREVKLGGASICYAPPDPTRDGDPRMPTETMKFLAGSVKSNSDTLLNTYPEVEEARVALLAAQRILGKDIAPVRVAYTTLYRNSGFEGGNDGEVYLKLLDGPFNLTFGGNSGANRTDVVGAVASPTTAIAGMSRKLGLASDLTKLESDGFDPASFLGDAKILGTIKLADYVPKAPDLTGPGAPKFVSREIPASGGQPAKVEARYDWQTKLSGMNGGLLIYQANGNDSTFRLQAITTTIVGEPNSANTITDSTIRNFKVNLVGCIVLWFRELNFKSSKGQKPTVSVDLHPVHAVEFGGPLEFVNRLKELLPGDGFSDPSALSVTASGIEAKYSLTIPKVQVGVFDLSGVSIGARFTLPFDVRPMEVGFNFGERENPFSLTVSLLGGGGFLSIGVGADGVREVEAAIEAGARCAIDLGVASGSVEIKAGIYFHWIGPEGTSDGLIQLTGYVRVHGELDVMAIISISLTFNLSLNFKKENGHAVIYGEASVVVEIEVLVFSGEVTVRCRREFVGADADPKFAQLIPADTTWSSYCSAFAEA